MAYETLQDIVSELADAIGIYDAPKRCEWESNLKARIRDAIEVEAAINARRNLSSPYDLSHPNHPARRMWERK